MPTTTTVQDIIDSVRRDVQLVIGSTHPALIDYVDRVHGDILLRRNWNFMLSDVQSFTTTVGATDYYIGPSGGSPGGSVIDTSLNLTDLGDIKHGTVFDRTTPRKIAHTDEAPLSYGFETVDGDPLCWRQDVDTPTILNLYPPQNQAYDVEFRYWKTVQSLSAVTDTLQIPDAYRACVIAGVNSLVWFMLKKDPTQGKIWNDIYETNISRMILSQNKGPRGAEFISPDPMSQYSVHEGIPSFFKPNT